MSDKCSCPPSTGVLPRPGRRMNCPVHGIELDQIIERIHQVGGDWHKLACDGKCGMPFGCASQWQPDEIAKMTAPERLVGSDRNSPMVAFETGATRSSDDGKLDFAGFLHPLVLEAYAEYMNVNRTQADGNRRDSDNWQKGMSLPRYIQSNMRHTFDLWKVACGIDIAEGELAAASGILFNVMGWMLERMKADPAWLQRELGKYKVYRAAELEARNKKAAL